MKNIFSGKLFLISAATISALNEPPLPNQINPEKLMSFDDKSRLWAKP